MTTAPDPKKAFNLKSMPELVKEVEERWRSIRSGETRWGPWRYNPEDLTLNYDTHPNYEIDLELLVDSATVLDWIIQLSQKRWLSHEDLGQLVRALDELLCPQEFFCSSGKNKRSNPRDILGR